MHQKSGATLQALGARMRMALETVGAMQSMVTAVPTTSSRMDKYAPLLMDQGLKGMIGKGKRSAEVREAIDRCKEFYGILKAYDKDSVTIADEDDKTTTFLKSDIALIRQAIEF